MAFIKSKPTDEEVKAFQNTKGTLLNQIGFLDIQKKRNLDEKDMSREIFKKMYNLLLPKQFNENALQPFLDSALNDEVYNDKGADNKEFSKELKKQEVFRLLAILKATEIKKSRK